MGWLDFSGCSTMSNDSISPKIKYKSKDGASVTETDSELPHIILRLSDTGPSTEVKKSRKNHRVQSVPTDSLTGGTVYPHHLISSSELGLHRSEKRTRKEGEENEEGCGCGG
jgi:hypothetical protein